MYNGDKIENKVNGKIINLRSYNTNNILKKLYLVFYRYRKIQKLKKELSIDTSISYLDNPNLINILTKKNDKVIITIHTFKSKRSKGLYGQIYKILIKFFFNKADNVITVSNDVKNDLINNFKIDPSKLNVIPNFLDADNIIKLSNEKIEDEFVDIYSSNNTIVNVGRLTEAKGQWHLIRAFSKVIKSIPESKLVIVCEGVFRNYLSRIIAELKLENKVYLIGNQNNPYKFIKNADIFVFSSIYEGFGLVLIEAMICKIPIISTNCKTGPSEILAKRSINNISTPLTVNYGVLTPVCDGNQYKGSDELTKEEVLLSESMIELLQNYDLKNKLVNDSKERIKDFLPEKLIKEWIKLIEEIKC